MTIFFIIILILVIFFLAVMYHDNKIFVVRKYILNADRRIADVDISNRASADDASSVISVKSEASSDSLVQCASANGKLSGGRRLKIVFISDLHGKRYGNDNEKLVTKIKELAPDIILIGGDMIVSKKAAALSKKGNHSWMEPAVSFIERLSKICPVYFANGNHENKLIEASEGAFRQDYDEYMRRIEETGAVTLHNEYTELSKEGFPMVRVYGYEHEQEYYEKIKPNPLPVEKVFDSLGKPDSRYYNIMIAHNPKFFPCYAGWGADLVVSGHVHGGLMRLGKLGMIGPDLHLFPKYSGGKYTLIKPDGISDSTIIVSCGIGAHTLPVRIFNPGEITYIEVENAEKPLSD